MLAQRAAGAGMETYWSQFSHAAGLPTDTWVDTLSGTPTGPGSATLLDFQTDTRVDTLSGAWRCRSRAWLIRCQQTVIKLDCKSDL